MVCLLFFLLEITVRLSKSFNQSFFVASLVSKLLSKGDLDKSAHYPQACFAVNLSFNLHHILSDNPCKKPDTDEECVDDAGKEINFFYKEKISYDPKGIGSSCYLGYF